MPELKPINLRQIVADYGTVVSLVAGLVWVGSELRSLRLMAETNQERVARVPTSEGVETAILKAVRPLDTGMAEVKAELRALNDRVRRLEDTGK